MVKLSWKTTDDSPLVFASLVLTYYYTVIKTEQLIDFEFLKSCITKTFE